jgi:hypothetical protein
VRASVFRFENKWYIQTTVAAKINGNASLQGNFMSGSSLAEKSANLGGINLYVKEKGPLFFFFPEKRVRMQ